jgi:hypothetical protein
MGGPGDSRQILPNKVIIASQSYPVVPKEGYGRPGEMTKPGKHMKTGINLIFDGRRRKNVDTALKLGVIPSRAYSNRKQPRFDAI